MSNEAEKRKARSIEVLKERNIPVLDSLPVIVTESGSTRRTVEEIVERAIALCTVALKAEGLELEYLEGFVKRYNSEKFFTPNELAFLGKENPDKEDNIHFTWRYESIAVLLWALSYIEVLEHPDSICNAGMIVQFIQARTKEELIEGASLRAQSEILDEADSIYRYHWAVALEKLKNDPTLTDLDEGVVYERHYTLNWLIGYMDQAWDDITTDT